MILTEGLAGAQAGVCRLRPARDVDRALVPTAEEAVIFLADMTLEG